MDKGCMPFVLGFILLMIIYGVLAQGETTGTKAFVYLIIFLLSFVGVWKIIKYFQNNH